MISPCLVYASDYCNNDNQILLFQVLLNQFLGFSSAATCINSKPPTGSVDSKYVGSDVCGFTGLEVEISRKSRLYKTDFILLIPNAV